MVNALAAIGVGEGDRVAKLAWNEYRQFELYYAVSGMSTILNTINPRLLPNRISYIVNHAEDSYVFMELTFVLLVEAFAGKLDSVKGFMIMTDAAHMPDTTLGDVLCYVMLLVVPMFQVNTWGIPYAATLCGAKLVFPGHGLDGASVHKLLGSVLVTLTTTAPTVWVLLFAYCKENGKTRTSLMRVVVGDAAIPRSVIQTFEEDHGVRMVYAWGMTETNPIGTIGTLCPAWRICRPRGATTYTKNRAAACSVSR